MGDLINGRTPEEIKRWIDSRVTCNTCPKEHEFGCEYGERTKDCQMCIDALAYIEHLEAQQPKWISVEERLPDAIAESGRVKTTETVFAMDSCGAVHVGYFTVYKYDGSNVFHGVDVEFFDDSPSDITNWMPLPVPPEEEG